MRLAYVCADPGVPVFGHKGCSIHVQEVLRALLRRGLEIALFTPRADGPRPAGLDAVELYPMPVLGQGATAHRERQAQEADRQIVAALAQHGPFDAVYERYSLWSCEAMEYGRDSGIPAVLEVNAPLIEEQKLRRTLADEAAAQRVAERAFAAATNLVAVSDAVAGYLQQRGVQRRRIAVIPNAVDPQRFTAIRPPRPRCTTAFTIGFLGTLKAWHGVQTLIEAFARLHRRDSSYRLLIVGDGPLRQSLEADLAERKSGLVGAAEFVGSVAHAEVPGWLCLMDVAAAPYPDLPDFYFSPLKVFEYMAAGLPVVTSRIGQLPHLIQDGTEGLLVPPGDAAAIAEAIGRLRRDPALAGRLGRAARARVARQYTWDTVAGKILQMIGKATAVAGSTS